MKKCTKPSRHRLFARLFLSIIACSFTLIASGPAPAAAITDENSIARLWNEVLLEAIRNDFARPTVHARNLFHVSAASWDAWAAYEPSTSQWLHKERQLADDVDAARETAISFATYRLLHWRFKDSPGAAITLPALDQQMVDLGLDASNTSMLGNNPIALGNRIAASYIAFGLQDNSNEQNDFDNRSYGSVNPPLLPDFPGNPDIEDPNRYQPLSLRFFFDQAGNPVSTGFPEFLSPEWGRVVPFALDIRDLELSRRGDFDYWTFMDPGAPPMLGTSSEGLYQAGFAQVVEWSGLLDPQQGEMIDISPASRGNNGLGNNAGKGHILNPATGRPYEPQWVPAGDYYRVLAEFWADGPDSETPPGHWFTIANTVSDHPDLKKQIGRNGPVLDALEWDIKLYFALGGAVHDAAVAAWGVKGRYDYIRPVSAIRAMADLGQSSDPDADNYHPQGLPLKSGAIEVITYASSRPGERHALLIEQDDASIGDVAVYAWRGPDAIRNPALDTAGVGWILARNWWPYQRPSFVTPPFAGYVSGHSTFSRAAAEVLTGFTGSAYFPGGMAEFLAPANDFLVFEQGPSVDVRLQWATYRDAADETSISRIYGGIHPTADDIPGRFMGAFIGVNALSRAQRFYAGTARNDIRSEPVLSADFEHGLSSLSGSWVDAQRPGEGWSVMGIDDNRALIYWLRRGKQGKPQWLWGIANRTGNVLAAQMSETSRDHGSTGEISSRPWGSLALTVRNCRSARVEYRPLTAFTRAGGTTSQRLTRLEGLPCGDDDANRTMTPNAGERSGVWLKPGQPGEGWIFESLPDGRMTVYWMGFDESGQAHWWFGAGQRMDNSLDLVLYTVTVADEPNSDADLTRQAGRAQVLFNGCRDALWRWTPAGSLTTTEQPIVQLFHPASLSCP